MITTPLSREAEPLEWSELHEWLKRSGRPDPWNRAAGWALDTLQSRLGDDWLKRAAKLRDEPPLSLHLLGIHVDALMEALEWALRLELSDRWDGSADFLRDLTRDPSPGRIQHSRSQLAQASFAERLGWPVALEPASSSGAPADLAIVAPSGPMLVEVRVLTPSQDGQRQHAVASDVSDWLLELRLRFGVWIGGRLGRTLSEDERRELEEFVRNELPRVEAGARPRFSRPGIDLELSRPDLGAPSLTSPEVREDLFARMVRAISDKAARMDASGAQWLHVTVLTGLWRFTSWGTGPLAAKAPMMSTALAEALGDRCPQGIVMTSATGRAPEGMDEDLARTPAGISLRLGVEALRARESLVMPFREGASAAAEEWLELARSESTWLPWALEERGLPSLPELLGLP